METLFECDVFEFPDGNKAVILTCNICGLKQRIDADVLKQDEQEFDSIFIDFVKSHEDKHRREAN